MNDDVCLLISFLNGRELHIRHVHATGHGEERRCSAARRDLNLKITHTFGEISDVTSRRLHETRKSTYGINSARYAHVH